MMRSIYWFIFVFSFNVAPFAAEPYTAVITADGTPIRSGPGIEYYPVLQLHTGDKVEIYHEQEDWCAVRPPIGSFSWVSAKYVEFGSGNIGIVLADDLASRIGSDDSDDCETIQVTLNKGETVFILERREMPENPVSPVWLKIAPPNGEFRWIHRSALGITPPIRQVRHDAMDMEIPDLPKIVPPELATIPVPALSTPKVAMNSPARTVTAAAIDPFQKAFNELQREAYVVMTRPADDDVFAVLIHRAEELHQIAPTDHDLERTYHLLESLQRTRTVRQELAQRRAVPSAASQKFSPLLPKTLTKTGTSGTWSPQRQSIVPAYTPTAAQSESMPIRAGVNVGGYDIVGRLGEFDGPLPKGHPPYAVVDEKEQIICLITPSANLDLSPYIGQFVGINGVLGYYEKQPGKPLARHFTARNIKTLR